eukprot:GFUD01113053.1.p1 GENE.GFUD01113053.1~~GFUD01113053.1.p1  ORF type:complete len:346 (+),score=69.72 GFUD01113053.1:48-1085(+)
MNTGFHVKHNCFCLQHETSNLRPLHAQVGGHVGMKIFDDRYVCKPLNRRELQFYQAIPRQLSQLVPGFVGTLTNGNAEDGEEFYSNKSKNCSDSAGSQTSDYLVLENLTMGYKKPCVLDLKMGTRMYGDFASEAKRQSQKKKTVKTTSAKLGVRFCGSQRFSVSKNNFEKLDKYVGRKASETEFRDLLENFFNNNGFLRRDIISHVINKIRDMRESLLDLNQFRFYSSSLLIIYEGQHFSDSEAAGSFESEDSMDCDSFNATIRRQGSYESEDSMDCDSFNATMRSRKTSLAKIKIIDFANATMPGVFEDDLVHEGPDAGFLLGLENLQDILESLYEDEPRVRKP